MTIALILHPYGEKNPGGLGRSIFVWIKTIVESMPGIQFMLVVKEEPEKPVPIEGNNFVVFPLKGKAMWMPGIYNSIQEKVDCFVFFTPIMPLFFKPKHSVAVVFDHAYLDLPVQGLRLKTKRFLLKKISGYTLATVESVAAISEYTKKQTLHHFSVNRNIQVIPVSHIPIPHAQDTMDFKEKTPYFLFAGVLKERKNVVGVVRGFVEFNKRHPQTAKLLIAGKAIGSYADMLKTEVASLGIQAEVEFLGYVPDEKMFALYKDATAVVFPSFIEGFGMPILEAMEVGVPVITSNYGAMAEVAGDAALLVDPKNPIEIGEGMETIFFNNTISKAFVTKGHARVAMYSWDKAAKGLSDLFVGLVTDSK